eukprot:1548219-Prymnesium_polylepis.1
MGVTDCTAWSARSCSPRHWVPRSQSVESTLQGTAARGGRTTAARQMPRSRRPCRRCEQGLRPDVTDRQRESGQPARGTGVEQERGTQGRRAKMRRAGHCSATSRVGAFPAPPSTADRPRLLATQH